MTNTLQFFKKHAIITMIISFFLANITVLTHHLFGLEEGQKIDQGQFFHRAFSDNLSTTWVAVAFLMFAGIIAAVNIVFPRLNKKLPLFLLVSAWIYFFMIIYHLGARLYFTFGILAVMAAIIIHMSMKSGSLPGLTTRKLQIITLILFCGIAVFIGVVTVLRYLTFVSPCFDFGIFAQMFEYMRTEGIPYTTCERDELLSHFAIHVSPAFYLLLPVYMIFPSPITLQVLQAIVVASAIFPLYMLCRQKKLPNIVTMFVLITFAFYPALAGGTMFDIHENMFLTTFMLWLFYFIEKADEKPKAWIGVAIFTMLVFSVKENTPIYTACIGLYVIFGKKKVVPGIVLFFMSISYFIFAIWFLDTFGRGVMTDSRLGPYAEGGSMPGVIRTIFLNPAFVLREVFVDSRDGGYPPAKILYMLRLMLPLAFLPLISKKSAGLVLLIPCILMNLMPNWPYQYDINFHYNFGNCAIFFYLFVVNFANFKPSSFKIKKFVLIFAMTASVFMFMSEMWHRHTIIERYKNDFEHHERMREMIANVPKDASVTAGTFLVAHFYQHKELYEFRGGDHTTDYIVWDMRWGGQFNNPQFIPEYEAKGYQIVDRHEGWIIIMKKGQVQIQ
jgi:uncharacterized membrane protein